MAIRAADGTLPPVHIDGVHQSPSGPNAR
jgi:hypothetical protein